MLEHDGEASPGLPQSLPGDERLLWQGSPDTRGLIVGSFHLPKLALYFAALLVVHFIVSVRAGAPTAEALASTTGYLILAAFALGLVAAYALLVSRTAMFSITNRRVVLRSGVAVPVTINLPYSRIEAADLRLHRDGTGDIAILPEAGSRVSWLLLWPMVKPWRLVRVRPVLRGVRDASRVAEILRESVTASFIERDAAAAETRADEVEAAAQATAGKSRWRPYPGIPLAAMVSLAFIALVGAGFTAFNEEAPEDGIVLAASVDLYFEDEEDGSVTVREADGGTVIDILEPGSNGFIRATLRTLATARRSVAAGAEEPFTVGRTENGRLFLIDAVSGREIDLRAFGPTNAGAFARYLDDDLPVTGEASFAPGNEQDVETTIALQQKESTP